jgi:hypothetical protein
MTKKEARIRRARQTRARISEQRATRLVVGRSNCHIYAQIIAPAGDKILASASTVEADVRKDLKNGGNKAAARPIPRPATRPPPPWAASASPSARRRSASSRSRSTAPVFASMAA